MSVVTSSQLSAKPIEFSTTLTLEEIRDAAWNARFKVSGKNSPTGWGSATDSPEYINEQPRKGMRFGKSAILPADNFLPRRLRLRYYWTATDSRLVRVNKTAKWQLTHVLHAADVLIYEADVQSTAIVTTRTPVPFKKASEAFQDLLRSQDHTAQMRVESIAGQFSNDFFLWLFNRCENSRMLDGGLVLQGMSTLSSMNGIKSARFKDGATSDRIEVVSLIAVSAGKFGPAKFSLASEVPEASFDLELHTDGSSVPYRSSNYEDLNVSREALGPLLIDDLYISVLPALRQRYEDDRAWGATGRTELIDRCAAAVRSALDAAVTRGLPAAS